MLYYGIKKPNYKTCSEYVLFVSWEDIPKKHIDTKVSYRNSYYFSSEEKMNEFSKQLYMELKK